MTHVENKTHEMMAQLNAVIDMDNAGGEAAHNIKLEVDDMLADAINQTLDAQYQDM